MDAIAEEIPQMTSAEVRAYLRSCCDICGIPHDPETHEASLRIRRGNLLGPIEDAPRKSRNAGCFGDGYETRQCSDCGADYLAGSPNSTRCVKCANKAQAESTRKSYLRKRKK